MGEMRRKSNRRRTIITLVLNKQNSDQSTSLGGQNVPAIALLQSVGLSVVGETQIIIEGEINLSLL